MSRDSPFVSSRLYVFALPSDNVSRGCGLGCQAGEATQLPPRAPRWATKRQTWITQFLAVAISMNQFVASGAATTNPTIRILAEVREHPPIRPLIQSCDLSAPPKQASCRLGVDNQLFPVPVMHDAPSSPLANSRGRMRLSHSAPQSFPNPPSKHRSVPWSSFNGGKALHLILLRFPCGRMLALLVIKQLLVFY